MKELSVENGNLKIVHGEEKTVYILSQNLAKLIKEIRQAYRNVTWGFGKYAMKIQIPPEYDLELDPSPNVGPLGGIKEAYAAQCDFLSVPQSPIFLYYIDELSKQSNNLELNFVSFGFQIYLTFKNNNYLRTNVLVLNKIIRLFLLIYYLFLIPYP